MSPVRSGFPALLELRLLAVVKIAAAVSTSVTMSMTRRSSIPVQVV
jgi:hypothetical protein